MSTEYSYTCDRCFQKAPGQAVFNTAKGARNWAPEGWMAVRINEDTIRSHMHFCHNCRKEFRSLVDDFLPEGQAVIVVGDENTPPYDTLNAKRSAPPGPRARPSHRPA